MKVFRVTKARFGSEFGCHLNTSITCGKLYNAMLFTKS